MAEEKPKAQSLTVAQKAPSAAVSAKGQDLSATSSVENPMDGLKDMMKVLINPLGLIKIATKMIPTGEESGGMKSTLSVLNTLASFTDPTRLLNMVQGKAPTLNPEGGKKGLSIPGRRLLTKTADMAESASIRSLDAAGQGLDKAGGAAQRGGRATMKAGSKLCGSVLGAIVGIPLVLAGATMTVGGTAAKVTGKAARGTAKAMRVARAIRRRIIAVTGAVKQAYRTAKRRVRRAMAPVTRPYKLLKRRVRIVRKSVAQKAQKIRTKYRQIKRRAMRIALPVRLLHNATMNLNHRSAQAAAFARGDQEAAQRHKNKARNHGRLARVMFQKNVWLPLLKQTRAAKKIFRTKLSRATKALRVRARRVGRIASRNRITGPTFRAMTGVVRTTGAVVSNGLRTARNFTRTGTRTLHFNLRRFGQRTSAMLRDLKASRIAAMQHLLARQQARFLRVAMIPAQRMRLAGSAIRTYAQARVAGVRAKAQSAREFRQKVLGIAKAAGVRGIMATTAPLRRAGSRVMELSREGAARLRAAIGGTRLATTLRKRSHQISQGYKLGGRMIRRHLAEIKAAYQEGKAQKPTETKIRKSFKTVRSQAATTGATTADIRLTTPAPTRNVQQLKGKARQKANEASQAAIRRSKGLPEAQRVAQGICKPAPNPAPISATADGPKTAPLTDTSGAPGNAPNISPDSAPTTTPDSAPKAATGITKQKSPSLLSKASSTLRANQQRLQKITSPITLATNTARQGAAAVMAGAEAQRVAGQGDMDAAQAHLQSMGRSASGTVRGITRSTNQSNPPGPSAAQSISKTESEGASVATKPNDPEKDAAEAATAARRAKIGAFMARRL